jgi:hypothetical protein
MQQQKQHNQQHKVFLQMMYQHKPKQIKKMQQQLQLQQQTRELQVL